MKTFLHRGSVGDFATGWCGALGTLSLFDLDPLGCALGGIFGAGILLALRFVLTHKGRNEP